MIGLLTRFLPNLIPSLGLFANPWVLLALLAALVGSFFYGLHIGNERLESYQIAVKAVGEAQEARTKLRIREQQNITKEKDRGHEKAYAALDDKFAIALGNYERLCKSVAGCGLLPPVPTTPSSGVVGAGEARVCFDRTKLERGLDKSLERFYKESLGVLLRGDRSRADFATCASWALEQWNSEKKPK